MLHQNFNYFLVDSTAEALVQSLFTSKYLSSGAATNIEEYVPTKTPHIIAKVNPLMTDPPKIYSDKRANKVVMDVITVRDKVSLIE